MNNLYLGDCLDVLRENIDEEPVDLVYIDPPFNSKREYSLKFGKEDPDMEKRERRVRKIQKGWGD